MNAIEISNLTKFYGKHKGVEAVNLTVGQGEVFGFIGPNGAGKSTTIRSMLALIYPTSGRISIFGRDAIKCASELAQRIGYLPGEVFYYDGMRVGELLNYAASFYRKDCRARGRYLCEALELDPSRKIEDLSYGNRKKVGIVQGLMHEPELILLDEPTGGLDPLMQNRFFDLIRAENQKGATVFFSSHILSEVQKMCSRVALIKDGTVRLVGTMGEFSHSYKKVSIESDQMIDQATIALAGATAFNAENGRVSFVYKGQLDQLTKRLAGLPLKDLAIAEPDLEEIFLNYYEREGEGGSSERIPS